MSSIDLTGQTLGQYVIHERLGGGAMGVVYRANQPALKRDVAIKVLSENLAAESGYMERFTREAETAAALEHPNIVPIHDYGSQRGTSYVVMRLLPGGSLKQRLEFRLQEGKLPSLGEVSEILITIAKALDHAHHRGVIHRDIKPSNIIFDDEGNPYVTDFGIAKLIQQTTSTLTGSMVVGTPAYMSPEQCTGSELTAASDQYALGVVAYVMLTGHAPFIGDSPLAVMQMHVHNRVPSITEEYPDIPSAVEEIIQRVLSKAPKDRYPSASAFAEAFAAAVRAAEGEKTGFATFALKPVPAPASGFSSSTALRAQLERELPYVQSRAFWFMIVLIVLLVAVIALLIGRNPASDGQAVAAVTEAITAEPSSTPIPTETASVAATHTRIPTQPPIAGAPPPTQPNGQQPPPNGDGRPPQNRLCPGDVLLRSQPFTLNVWRSPQDSVFPIGTIPANNTFRILFISGNGQWLQVEFEALRGWVHLFPMELDCVIPTSPPPDIDRDGVPDDADQCPTTDGGENAVAGCPDTDADGVPDNNDQCITTPGLDVFRGCPDTDEDGVQDSIDQCPSSPGMDVFGGCPDTDSDGVPDNNDQCPNTAGVDALRGCPEPTLETSTVCIGLVNEYCFDLLADDDGDGVDNAPDDCPFDSGNPDIGGCPDTPDNFCYEEPTADGQLYFVCLSMNGDIDEDAFINYQDGCPFDAGFAEFGGCPTEIDVCHIIADGEVCLPAGEDADDDGIINSFDLCPIEPGQVDFDGCAEDFFD